MCSLGGGETRRDDEVKDGGEGGGAGNALLRVLGLYDMDFSFGEEA